MSREEKRMALVDLLYLAKVCAPDIESGNGTVRGNVRRLRSRGGVNALIDRSSAPWKRAKEFIDAWDPTATLGHEETLAVETP